MTTLTSAESIGKHYEHQWKYLGPFSGINFKIREEILLRIVARDKSDFKGKRVLVAGCGYGWEVYIFNKFGAIVTGVDLYVGKALYLLKFFKVDLTKSNIKILQQDIERLDLSRNQFDYIYCNGVLHHTPNPHIGLDNLVKVLKPKGELLLGLYESGGFFWYMIKFLGIIVRWLSIFHINQEHIAKILNRASWYKGIWSNRFPSRIERIVWTIENLYVPIIKTFSPIHIESMMQSRGLVNIVRWDEINGKYLPSNQIKDKNKRKGSDIGYLLYRAYKDQA